MPVEVGVWRVNNGEPERLRFTSIEAESRLEDILKSDIGILDPTLMLIGSQVQTDYGGRIDLLAIDGDGDVTVIELKRNMTPREVAAQVLDYASWVQGLTYERITDIYAEQHSGKPFEQAFSEQFDTEELPERLNESHRLLIVASELDSSTERIIDYLSANYGVPINGVFFRYFKDGENEYLARTWLIDPNQAESQASLAASTKSSKEPWNGKDFYVSLGEDHRRNWEDCRSYGFVSAGGGRWYSATLGNLFPGARVSVNVPGKGYVGIGTVTEEVVPIRDFTVEVDGKTLPVLEAPRRADQMGEDADDPNLSEYAVRVEWEKTVPVGNAVWEKGMFASQHSACKLRNRFTLDRLAERFKISV